ncbi:MAG: DUF2167 domain-containing protein [Gammaproteobacteria bacterium]|nr:DUF2167 domain-containing protein [Gammaproteobacteria bacterium]
MKLFIQSALTVAILFGTQGAWADNPTTPDSSSTAANASASGAQQPKMTKEEFLNSLHYQTGKITIPNGMATLDLSDKFKYLPPADASRVLQAWGNPAADTQGMIVPADGDPLSQDGWGVIISYMDDGHVKDNDADDIKYDELLKTMQQATLDHNEERTKAGYSPIKLEGWAEQPTYDKQTHKYYWAEDISSAGQANHTLNYSVRVLGRKGVLVLNAMSNMDQLSSIKTQMKDVTAFSQFTPSNRYEDFDDKTDKVAAYGLAALVAGGVAAKLGLFAKLVAILIALKKLIVVGVVAAFAGIKKFFGRKAT